MDEILADLGITLIGTWPSALRANFDDALFNRIGVEKLKLWFKDLPVSFRFGGSEKLVVGSYYGLTSGSKITFFANQNTNPVINILHECGHVVDNLWEDFFTNNLKGVEFRRKEAYFAGWNGFKYLGLRGDIIRAEVLKERRVAGGDAWQQRGGTPHWEDWADIFSNVMLENINEENELGRQILDFVTQMETHTKKATGARDTPRASRIK